MTISSSSRDRRRGVLTSMTAVGLTAVIAAGSAAATGTVAADSTTPSTTASAPAGATTGELVVWDWDSADPGFAKAMAASDAAFIAAHPGVTIKRVNTPFGGYAQAFQTTLAGGDQPCVAEFLAAASGPAVLRFKDALTEISAKVDAKMRENLVGLETASENFDATGKIYGLPYGLQPQTMYYNKALFTQAGLDPNKPPTTFAELISTAEALKAKGITPFVGGNKEGYATEWWFSWLWTGRGTVEDSLALARGEMKFTDPKVQATVEDLKGMIDKHLFNEGFNSTPMATAMEDFAAGKGAMTVGLGGGGFGSHKVFNEALGVDNVGVILGNGGTGTAPLYLSGGPASTWAVTKSCAMQDVAFEYIKYLAGEEASKVLYENAGVLPGWKTVTLPDSAPPQAKQLVEAYRAAKSLYAEHGLWKAEPEGEFLRQVQLALQGEQSIADALAAVQKVADTAK